MPLEATMFILDNSKYSRNGDILPTRFDAQVHVLGKYVDSKLNENPESCVGLMTMGGNKADCLVTLVKEKQEIMGNIGKISLGGELAFLKAVQIAQLALKHRSNKHQAQRIVAIVASPVEERQQELVAFAKTLRRNNIAINIMNLGEAANVDKLQAMVDAANSDDNSSFRNIEPSANLPGDAMLSPGFIGGADTRMDNMGDFGAGAGGDMDPELEMALRISLEEERLRQDHIRQNYGAEAPMQQEAPAQAQETQETLSEQEADLIQQAQNISLNEKENEEDTEGKETDLIHDPNFIKEVLEGLDLGDDTPNELLEGIMQQEKKDEKKEEEKKDDK